MSKIIKIKCSNCGNEFDLVASQYKYHLKKERDSFYCSLKCAGSRKDNIKRLVELSEKSRFNTDSPRYTKLDTAEKLTESSMREFVRRFNSRAKSKRNGFKVEVSKEYLTEIWKKQNGKCYFTNIPLVLPRDQEYKTCSSNSKASVDRIDCKIGYVEGNVRFVSHTVNLLKHTMDDSSVLDFFNIIKTNI